MSGTAILLCGHGSRDPAALAEFETAAAGLHRRLCGYDFAIGYLEFSRPTIADGLAALAARGAGRICLVPGMLFAARHVKADLPAIMAGFAAAHRGLDLRLARDLAGEAGVLGAAAERVAAAAPAGRAQAALVVVGRGTGDRAANAGFAASVERLRRRLGFAHAEAAFAGIAEPGLAAALARAAGLGFSRIVVFPHFLFAGVLVGRVGAEIEAAAARFPAVAVVMAGHLGAHPRVLDALAGRAEDALRPAGTGD